MQAPKMLVSDWSAWEESGKEGRAGTLVEVKGKLKYTKSSDLYTVGVKLLLQYKPTAWWQRDPDGQEFLSHLLGHTKTVEELLRHKWLEQVRDTLPGEQSMGLGSDPLIGMTVHVYLSIASLSAR
jgi:hypothetical protein